MNKKKVGVIASACATCAVCASMIVGSTYALFTSNDKVDISVTAGTVKVSAEVEKSSVKLESMGEKLEGNVWANGGTAGFNDESVLELTYITPGDAASFNIKITNESTVNVQYRINWSVEGELADVLVAEANVAKFGYWTEWIAPKTDEEKVKTVTVTVALPESAGNEYQGAETSISFTVEAVQGNADVKDEVASVNGVGYETFEEALAAANAGDTIKLTHSEVGEEVRTLEIDKDITIAGNGEATFNNTHIIVKNNAEVIFDKVNFKGDSYINVSGAGVLNMTGCVANVSPSMISGRGAFIVAPDETRAGLKLNIVGNVINAANSTADPLSTGIFVWAYLNDSVIANNTFGNENNRYGFVAVKTLGAMNGATIKLENNTVYGTAKNGYLNNYYFQAFQFVQNTSINNALTVLSSNNTIYAESNGGDDLRAFAIGDNSGKKNFTLIDEGTTLNGKLIKIEDIDVDDSNYPLYINLNGDEKISDKVIQVATQEEFTEAIANIKDGAMLLLSEGTYSATAENQLIISANNVRIKGAGAEETVIDCGNYAVSSQAGIYVSGNNVTISDLTVKSTSTNGDVAALKVSNISEVENTPCNVTIKNVIVECASGNGVSLHGVNGVIVDNVKVTAFKAGFAIAAAKNVEITNCTVVNDGNGWQADIGFMWSSNAALYPFECDNVIIGEGNSFGYGMIYSENPNGDKINYEALGNGWTFTKSETNGTWALTKNI